MYKRFFEPDQKYVGYFKFPKDPDMVPGHLVIIKNTIRGQLYRAPEDIIEDPDMPFGRGLDTRKALNAIGVFRLKDGKDLEVSIFGLQIRSYSTSQLDFYDVVCKSMFINGHFLIVDKVIPQKVIINISGLEEWFEKRSVNFFRDGNRISLSSGSPIIESVYSCDHFTINIECYTNFSLGYRDNYVKEKVLLGVHFHKQIGFQDADQLTHKIRQVFSLFFRLQLKINNISFLFQYEAKEYYYIFSDSRDYFNGAKKNKNEAIIRYSDTELFKEVINNFLNAEPRLKRLMDTFFLMELNHSLYSENAFLIWVFELDFFIKKGKQKNIPREDAMKELSQTLISKLKNNDDPLLEELFEKWYCLSNEKAKFYG